MFTSAGTPLDQSTAICTVSSIGLPFFSRNAIRPLMVSPLCRCLNANDASCDPRISSAWYDSISTVAGSSVSPSTESVKIKGAVVPSTDRFDPGVQRLTRRIPLS